MESLEIMQRTADSLAAAMAIGERATTQAQNCKTLVAQLRLLASFLDTLVKAETQAAAAAAAAGPGAGKGSGRGVSFAILVQNLDSSVRDAAALLQRCALPPSRMYSAVRSDMMEHQFGDVSSQIRYNVADIITSLPDLAPQLPILKSKANQIGAAVNSANYIDDAAARNLGGEVDTMVRGLRHRLKPGKAALRALASRLELGSADEFEIESSALGAFMEAFAMEGDAEEEAYLGEALGVLRLMEAVVCREEEEGDGGEEGGGGPAEGAGVDDGPAPGRGIFQRLQAAMRLAQPHKQADQLQTKAEEGDEAVANKEESESSSSSENSPLSSVLTPKSPSSPPRSFLPPPHLKPPFLPPPPSLAAVVAARAAAAAAAPPNSTFSAKVTASVQPPPASAPPKPTTDHLSETLSGPRTVAERRQELPSQGAHAPEEARIAVPAGPTDTPPRPALMLTTPAKAAMGGMEGRAAMVAALPSPKSAVPQEFLCPLSGRLMADPVVIASGLTFDRASITDWFNGGTGKGRGGRGVAVKTLEEGARLVCPVTNDALPNTQMRPNISLRASISSWRSQNPTAALAALAPRAARAMKVAAEAAAAAEAQGANAAAGPGSASSAATAEAVLSAVTVNGANEVQPRGVLAAVVSAAVSATATKAAPSVQEDSPPRRSSPSQGVAEGEDEHAGAQEQEQAREHETATSVSPSLEEAPVKKLGLGGGWSRGSAKFGWKDDAEDTLLPDTATKVDEAEAQDTADSDTDSEEGTEDEAADEEEVETEQEPEGEVEQEACAKAAGHSVAAGRMGVPDFRAVRARAQWDAPRPGGDSREGGRPNADVGATVGPTAGPLRSRLSASTGSLPDQTSVTRGVGRSMAGVRAGLLARARTPPLVAEREEAEMEEESEDKAVGPREGLAPPKNMPHGSLYAEGLLAKYAKQASTARSATPPVYGPGQWGARGDLAGGATPRAFNYGGAAAGGLRGAEYGAQGATPQGRVGVAAGDFTPRAVGGLAGARGARAEPWIRQSIPAAKQPGAGNRGMPGLLAARQQAWMGSTSADSASDEPSSGIIAVPSAEAKHRHKEMKAAEELPGVGEREELEEEEVVEDLPEAAPVQAWRQPGKYAAGVSASAPLWGPESSSKGSSRGEKDQATPGAGQGGRFAAYLRQSEEDSRFLEQSFSLSTTMAEEQDEEEPAAPHGEDSDECEEADTVPEDSGERSEAGLRHSASSLQRGMQGLGLAHSASGVSLASSTSNISVGLGAMESSTLSSGPGRAREGADSANEDLEESLGNGGLSQKSLDLPAVQSGLSQKSSDLPGVHSWAPLDDVAGPTRLPSGADLLISASSRTESAASISGTGSPDLAQNRSISHPPAGSGAPAVAARLQPRRALDSPFESPARTNSVPPAVTAAADKAAKALFAQRRSMDGGAAGAVVGQSPASSPASSESSRSTVPAARVESRSADEATQLVVLLASSIEAERLGAAKRIRELTRSNAENRARLGSLGAVHPLVSLMASSLSSPATKAAAESVEAAVYALLNLSIYDGNKRDIVTSGGLEALVHVLKTGNPSAREGAAATLFSLSSFDDNKVAIGQAGAIPMLIDTLINGTPRGQQDALLALFNLSLVSCNKGSMIREGLLRHLVRVIENDPTHAMAEKCMGIMLSLCSRPEGRNSLVGFKGLRALALLLRNGSKRGQEDAAAACLILVGRDPRHTALLARENVEVSLVALAEAGSARAKDKAKQVLQYLGKGGRGGRGPSIPSIAEDAPPTPQTASARVSPLGAN